MQIPEAMEEKNVLHPVTNANGETIGYALWCEGCKDIHVLMTNKKGGPNWQFSGNLEKPTFTPSLKCYAIPAAGDFPGHPRCHSLITNGQMTFLGDSTHALAGKTVPLKPWSDEDL